MLSTTAEHKSNERTRNVLVHSGATERSESERWHRGPAREFGTLRPGLFGRKDLSWPFWGKMEGCPKPSISAPKNRILAMAPRPRGRFWDPPCGPVRVSRYIIQAQCCQLAENKSNERTRNVFVHGGATERSDSERWHRGPERGFETLRPGLLGRKDTTYKHTVPLCFALLVVLIYIKISTTAENTKQRENYPKKNPKPNRVRFGWSWGGVLAFASVSKP